MVDANGHDVENRTSWQWNHPMTGQLIAKLKELKNEMDYQNMYVVTMYSKLRERMAEQFPDSFGRVQFVSHKLMILMIAWFVRRFPH